MKEDNNIITQLNPFVQVEPMTVLILILSSAFAVLLYFYLQANWDDFHKWLP